MINIVLVEPEIAGNTGNIIRMCANSGAALHLVEPLGYSMQSSLLKRAGLDYHEYAEVSVHSSLDAVRERLGDDNRWFATTARGATRYDEVRYRPGDVVLFGRESTGLDDTVLATVATERWLYVPMRPDNRSLNLSNTAAIITYEAWRQQSFPGSAR